jgi:hypothetical protein
MAWLTSHDGHKVRFQTASQRCDSYSDTPAVPLIFVKAIFCHDLDRGQKELRKEARKELRKEARKELRPELRKEMRPPPRPEPRPDRKDDERRGRGGNAADRMWPPLRI